MNVHILQIEFATPAFDEALALRDLVLRKPLALQFHTEDITAESSEIHIVAYTDLKQIVGSLTLRLISTEEIKMRQVAVHPEAQGQQIGAKLVAESERVAKQLGHSIMTLHARDTAIPFYKRLGYSIIGDGFDEVNIPHHKMYKNL